jgi:uridine kinase
MGSTTLMVTIDRAGRVVVEVSGVSGPACTHLTKEFEEALGGEILERRHLDAYYEEDGQERLHLGRGE